MPFDLPNARAAIDSLNLIAGQFSTGAPSFCLDAFFLSQRGHADRRIDAPCSTMFNRSAGGVAVKRRAFWTTHISGICTLGERLLIRQALVTATLALVIACGLSVRQAQADYLVTLQQVGPNVVATGSGSIDLSGLSFQGNVLGNAGLLLPNEATVLVGSGNLDFYTGFSGPSSFGSAGQTNANSNSGSLVGISGKALDLFVPSGYTSNTLLSPSTSTYNNATFGSLGITPGTYVWTWGAFAPTQKFTLDAVPEPSSLSLLALGVILLSAKLRALRPAPQRASARASRGW
jgi:hypothetical protein